MTTNIVERETTLVPRESFELGEIDYSSIVQRHPSEFGITEQVEPLEIYSIDINDPYINALPPKMLQSVREREREIDELARERRLAGLWQRAKGTAYIDEQGESQQKRSRDWGDPVSKEAFFGGLQSDGLYAWLRLVPTAKALYYLSEPFERDEISTSSGKHLGVMDEKSRLWLAACSDAIGIRSRGTVMAELINQYVAERDDTKNLRWTSVACGTALPAMKAAIRANVSPKLELLDIDDNAMRATQDLATEIGFSGDISQSRIDIFNMDVMRRHTELLQARNEQPDIVDLMGIFEYTGDELQIDSAEFLRANYDMLKSGGRLVFGQMRSDRPNPDFTMGAVCWPYIEMRSPQEFMEVVARAGISPSEVKLYMANDGVYTVGCIDKP